MMPEEKGIVQFFSCCLIFFLSTFLVRQAMKLLRECWLELLIVAIIAILAIIAWRVYIHYHSLGKW